MFRRRRRALGATERRSQVTAFVNSKLQLLVVDGRAVEVRAVCRSLLVLLDSISRVILALARGPRPSLCLFVLQDTTAHICDEGSDWVVLSLRCHRSVRETFLGGLGHML